MISVILGLVVVTLLGGAVASHVRKNPTSATRIRAQRRARSTSRKQAKNLINRARGSAPETSRIGRGVNWTVGYVRTRKDRASARVKAAHAEAKKHGLTAATRVKTIAERRGWRGAWSDVREAFGRPAREQHAEAATDDPPEQPKPKTTTTTSTTDTERGTPVPETELKTAPTTSAPTPSAAPSVVTLFEISDQMAMLPFESLIQIRQFTTSLAMGCDLIARMYVDLSARMAGPFFIDRIVTEPVEKCGAHQRAVKGAVTDAQSYLTGLLNMTPKELLALGVRLPKASLINGQASMLGSALVPSFYEASSTLATRAVTDLRDVHVLLKALVDASDGQWKLYRRVATRLAELRVAATQDYFWAAARQQAAVTASLADADTAMGRLLSMTLLELATSGVRAPEMQLTGI